MLTNQIDTATKTDRVKSDLLESGWSGLSVTLLLGDSDLGVVVFGA